MISGNSYMRCTFFVVRSCIKSLNKTHENSMHKNFKFFQPRVTFYLSSELNKKNPCPANRGFEQRVFFNNTGHSTDAQNFKYENMQ